MALTPLMERHLNTQSGFKSLEGLVWTGWWAFISRDQNTETKEREGRGFFLGSGCLQPCSQPDALVEMQ